LSVNIFEVIDISGDVSVGECFSFSEVIFVSRPVFAS
jgi:hypothetical protein